MCVYSLREAQKSLKTGSKSSEPANTNQFASCEQLCQFLGVSDIFFEWAPGMRTIHPGIIHRSGLCLNQKLFAAVACENNGLRNKTDFGQCCASFRVKSLRSCLS